MKTSIEDIERFRPKEHLELEPKGEVGAERPGLQLRICGGYNDIWLVRSPLVDSQRHVLCKPEEDVLLSIQVRNEIA